jgi:hypothetical protein
MKRVKSALVVFLAALIPCDIVRAEEPTPTESAKEAVGTGSAENPASANQGSAKSATAPMTPAAEASPTQEKKSKKNQSKGKRVREREQEEGTQAPDRFEANTVIKSKYYYNGEPLEVDPD